MLAALRPPDNNDQVAEMYLDGNWQEQEFVDGRVTGVAAFWAPVDPFARYRTPESR